MLGSGVGIDYANGATQVTYQDEKPNPRMMLSRLGDPVILCLVKLDTTCPEHDDRGRIYKTNSLRTKKTWQSASLRALVRRRVTPPRKAAYS